MLAQGCKSAVMEVSSHALALKRVDGMRFAAAIFTNLTRDHLDFHEDMETYFLAKRRLFEMLPRRRARRDQSRRSARSVARRDLRPPVTFALTRPADVTPGPLAITLDGLTFDINTPRGVVPIRSPLVGRPNVSNILAAAGHGSGDGPAARCDRQRCRAACPACPAASRWSPRPSDDVTVVVDYAHTDDALRNLLETARPLAPKRLVTVFGCGGDRDKTKRPLMGMVAARLSDVVVITSDNPRSEDPLRIIDEIKRGIPAGSQSGRPPDIRTIVDRREAIELAVDLAGAGDVVLVAGKGHEKYQQIGGSRAAVRRRRSGANGAVAPAAADEGELRMAAMVLTAAMIASATGGYVRAGAADRAIDGFAIDSRTLQPGDLFFAIVAARDGHDVRRRCDRAEAPSVRWFHAPRGRVNRLQCRAPARPLIPSSSRSRTPPRHCRISRASSAANPRRR